MWLKLLWPRFESCYSGCLAPNFPYPIKFYHLARNRKYFNFLSQTTFYGILHASAVKLHLSWILSLSVQSLAYALNFSFDMFCILKLIQLNYPSLYKVHEWSRTSWANRRIWDVFNEVIIKYFNEHWLQNLIGTTSVQGRRQRCKYAIYCLIHSFKSVLLLTRLT